jgi:hypothetical protein
MGITTTRTAGTARITETVNITIGSKGGSKESSTKEAEEDEKPETEDKECGRNVLDNMINKLGTRKEVEKDIRDHCWKR